jgi:beta-glucosidase
MDYDGNAALTKLFTVETPDATTYAVSQTTGNEILNLFDDTDLRTYDPSYRYLSRSDWNGTWPTVYANGSYTAPDTLLKQLVPSYTENPSDTMPVFDTINGTYGKLTAATLVGADFDDPRWDALLNQLTPDEMINLVRVGGYATTAIPNIGLPGTIDKDGPAGISGTLTGGNQSCLSYPVEVVLAATWNVELAKEVGECIGEDSINSGITGWYAPAANTHRIPNGGRNFEYYSEDPFLSGKICANETAGVVGKGTIVFMKHYALNDQEMSRAGGSMFANEQAIREIFLRPFEFAVREGGANGAMSGHNRLGPRWAGGHRGLMTGTLREEWGFVGIVITDQASLASFAYQDRLQGIEAGNNLWLNSDENLWKIPAGERTPTVMNNIRKSAHTILYTIVNSNGMNGVAADSLVKNITPGWMILGYVALAIFALLLVWWAVRITLRLKRRNSITLNNIQEIQQKEDV